jgi:cytidine deaminase
MRRNHKKATKREQRLISLRRPALAAAAAGNSRAAARWRGALVAAAARARRRAVAPYSKFKVGAALLTQAGKLVTGANVESASYGLTCCAERVALFTALASGERNFAAVAVVARAPGGPMPCGACRQLLAEYASHARVWVADARSLSAVKEFSVSELLPAAFIEVPEDSD